MFSMSFSPSVAAELQDRMAESAMSPERRGRIDQIIQINKTAAAEFLEAFDDAQLDEYARRLNASTLPRGRGASWVRSDSCPAFTWRETAA